LLELRKQVFAMELLLLVPTDLTGDENHASRSDDDSVGVSDRGSPTLRKQYRHGSPPFKQLATPHPKKISASLLIGHGRCGVSRRLA
jgi:hypothetical protein